jgi:sugar phosphate isomerase/epimerase
VKLAAQLYNCRDYTKTPAAIEATLKRVREIGYEVIQISGFGPCDPDRLAGMVRDAGLEVCITHSPWGRLSDPAELKRLIAEHKQLGCPYIGLGARPGDAFPNSWEGWTRFIRQAGEIAARIQGEGLGFSYHNHDFEFERFRGVSAIDRLIEECPALLFTLDVFWVQAGGGSPAAYVKKLEGRIRVIHLKDYRMVNGVRQFAEIGQGVFDWGELIPLCDAAGVRYAAIEQDADWLIDPFESLAASRDFLVHDLPSRRGVTR